MSSSNQEFTRTLWNLQALDMILKKPLPVPIQSQINAVDAVPKFLNINLNILVPS
jgi:hypothetical protein